MRRLAIAFVLAVLTAPVAASAAEPAAQVKPDDYVKAIQAAPVAQDAASAPAAPSPDNPCKPGYVLDSRQICQRVISTRGFSLATDAAQPATPAPKAQSGERRPAARPMAPIHVSAPPPSRLSDLLITFKLGSAQLTEQGRANARSFADALMNPAVRATRFEIAGHTDASGSADRNQELSQQRAEAVKDFLVGQGVDPSRLEVKGYGSSELARPEAPRSSANRRVEARRLS
jgi:outer membrane protein OmpA-like peptidoglycan-associated protein